MMANDKLSMEKDSSTPLCNRDKLSENMIPRCREPGVFLSQDLNKWRWRGSGRRRQVGPPAAPPLRQQRQHMTDYVNIGGLVVTFLDGQGEGRGEGREETTTGSKRLRGELGEKRISAKGRKEERNKGKRTKAQCMN